MATTTTPQARMPTPVTTAATRPVKTKTFLAKIRAALIIFNDQISSLDEGCANAFETFITPFRTPSPTYGQRSMVQTLQFYYNQ